MTDFQRLTQNAFDFLNHALAQLQTAPKHSVINFYSAVELFLKARLLLEHWTLVLAKEKSRKAFEEGDIVSAPFELACTRLDEIVGSPLKREARAAFDTVRKHRNRMVHFHHAIQDGNPAIIATIASEQLRAWHYLHELLTVQWKNEFADFGPQIAAIGDDLSGHRTYIHVAYDNLRTELAALASQGTRIEICPFCRVATMIDREVENGLHEINCRICGHYWNELYLECEECGREGSHMGGTSFECAQCTHVMYADDIERYWCTPGNRLEPCPECHRQRSVLRFGSSNFCLGCLEIVSRSPS